MITAEREFIDIVADILFHPEFMQLKNFKHHTTNRYEHVVLVSYLSYKNARKLNLDYRSAARGGLLHDFFLYDWREYTRKRGGGGRHFTLHPKTALKNSRRYFKLNGIEEDIIVKHMWPSTLYLPRYKESLLVSFVDKYVSVREYMAALRWVNPIVSKLNLDDFFV